MTTPADPHVAYCALTRFEHDGGCGWTEQHPDEEQAQWAGTWHIHDVHPLVWLGIIGERPPNRPRPWEGAHGMTKRYGPETQWTAPPGLYGLDRSPPEGRTDQQAP